MDLIIVVQHTAIVKPNLGAGKQWIAPLIAALLQTTTILEPLFSSGLQSAIAPQLAAQMKPLFPIEPKIFGSSCLLALLKIHTHTNTYMYIYI